MQMKTCVITLYTKRYGDIVYKAKYKCIRLDIITIFKKLKIIFIYKFITKIEK